MNGKDLPKEDLLLFQKGFNLEKIFIAKGIECLLII